MNHPPSHNDNDMDTDDEELIPHAFHWNLPRHHLHSNQNHFAAAAVATTTTIDQQQQQQQQQQQSRRSVPMITKFAYSKARGIVQLCHSIQLSDSLFDPTNNGTEFDDDVVMDEDDDGEDDEEDEEDDDDLAEDDTPVDATSSSNKKKKKKRQDTFATLMKKCFRLSSQVHAWEGFKYGGISTEEVAHMILHLLRLVTATLVAPDDKDSRNDNSNGNGSVICYEPTVGHLKHYHRNNNESSTPNNGSTEFARSPTAATLQQELQRPFALPAPARDSLLSVLVQFLSNKGPLRSLSNAALDVPNDDDNNNKAAAPPVSLMLHWQVLLRLLLRTAPFLDAYQTDAIPRDSSARVSTIQKRTVQLVRDARRFFDSTHTPQQVWDMVRTDVLFHSHTQACYRGTILLHLFLPSRCWPEFYQAVLPDWLNAWTNIDRCPEYDFLWLALFCRARKYLPNVTMNVSTSTTVATTTASNTTTDWPQAWRWIRRRLLTLCQYWCLLPIGGVAPDKSWTQAPHARSRACPAKLKALATAGSSYEEGIDFVAKIAKLLVAGLGTQHLDTTTTIDATKETTTGPISEGTADILKFLTYVTPYFHPSNLGSWTFTLGAFLHYFCYELACRLGTTAGLNVLQKQHPALYTSLAQAQPAFATTALSIPPHEVVALVHALMPLCQQAMYSKNSHVSRAAEAAMLYLVQLDPQATAPVFCDFGMRALDIQAVHSAHQAPAAISALTRLIQPTLRRSPAIFLQRLPTILQLTLAGIDSNDQNKTIRTLILYRSLASWLPIGINPRKVAQASPHCSDQELEEKGIVRLGTDLLDEVKLYRQSPEYQGAIAALPTTSLLRHLNESFQMNLDDLDDGLLEEVGASTSDWTLEFLERVYELLRSSGEREKQGKRSSGVASRHSSADVHAARNFSRVLKESLFQVFAAMDDVTFKLAANSVHRFVDEESLPAAAKDASLLCQAVSAARGVEKNPGLDIMVPLLTDDLAHHSNKTAIYRVRCLAGSVRLSGQAILKHTQTISDTLDFCFKSSDRDLFKTGCKLLRHTLSTLTEPYPLPSDSRPRVYSCDDGTISLGKSAELTNDPIQWHVPNKECVEFAWKLLDRHLVHRLNDLSAPVQAETGSPRSKMLYNGDIQEIRRCLRLIRYCIRGGASILVDEKLSPPKDPKDSVPHEVACHRILEQASAETQKQIIAIRRNLCTFLVVLSSIIGSDTLHPGGLDTISSDDSYSKTVPLISRDPKVCKETCDIALLLLTRRGASFRSQEAMTVWKAQKQISNDYILCAEVDVLSEAFQAAGTYSPHVLYKDGEDGGKSIPRRVLVSRVHLFHNAMIRNASFEVPRRMRRMKGHDNGSRTILFQAKSNLPDMLSYLETVLVGDNQTEPLDGYEGILDGLHSLCCHSNTQVRASAIGVVDYALTRFGWLLKSRIHRLLSALSLQDADQNGKFGIPSCASLTEELNNQGKRKRLSEALKGVCSVLSLQRTTKFVLGSHKLRLQFMKSLCETDKLISLMPAEEMQKMIHYMHNIFSPFRSKNFNLPRPTRQDKEYHNALIKTSLQFLSERKRVSDEESSGDKESEGGAAVHWRKLLQACWFLLVSIDQEDIAQDDDEIVLSTWKTSLRLLENEKGQPLQRVSLGLLGKLSFMSEKTSVESTIGTKLEEEPFCRAFADALVYDHKEDTGYGGGHDAQWSAGVEDIIREASRFVAPRSLFPFQRSNLGSGSFKVSHCQLLTHILSCMKDESTVTVVDTLLSISKEYLSAPPNEDQKNQQVTSAEIFAGICSYYISSGQISDELWKNKLLPHFEEAIGKVPFNLVATYSDAIRFSFQFCNPSVFQPLIEFMVEKTRKSLWQRANGSEESVTNSSHGTDGFNAQSKWLYLISSILVELDISESDGVEGRTYWYLSPLTNEDCTVTDMATAKYEQAWAVVTEKLLPHLLEALGHPFHSCRDHISRLLFRICSCHRKRARTEESRAPSRANSSDDLMAVDSSGDPGSTIILKLSSLTEDESLSFLDKYNALSTARRFLSYCLHLGEAKFELTDYVIPALPTVFESLKSTVEDSIAKAGNIATEDQAAWRALEAEVLKGFRYSVSEISQTTTSFDRMADIDRIFDFVQNAANHETWQVRHASAHFLRCFQGSHKFTFAPEHTNRTMTMVASLLADERREVCSAAMAALTGLLCGLASDEISVMVNKYVVLANRSKIKRKKNASTGQEISVEQQQLEEKRARNQQTSVYFLCAAIMAQPYDTPPYVPVALSAISKHSFEKSAPLSIRDTVKKCCAEYKRTHMSDNWEEHRAVFSQEQMEALEDVVSTPHYYA